MREPRLRIGEPSEVSKVVLFLASDDASFVTAENITVGWGIAKVVFGDHFYPFPIAVQSCKT